MIVSHRHKFIFIKTHKTAGSSMEMALAPLCGADDIITPMESNVGTDIPRNFHEDTLMGRSYARSRLFRKCIDRHSPRLGKWFYEHMPAWRVRELVGEDVWETYYKFCFERNPWDKVVSYYNWKKYGQKRKMPDFKSYVMTKSHRLPLDARLYFEGDKCLVDRVADYADFLEQFDAICKKLCLPFDGDMPREKTAITSGKVDYREYYDEESKRQVALLFHREIALKKFVFDSTHPLA
ncbi:MAG: sulfotransferase family 2 domain-containing protein [Verrucomicrobiota bacterium]